MAEGGQKRSPTAHRTKAQIKRHYKEYQGKPDQIAARARRNSDRAKLKKRLVKTGKPLKRNEDAGHSKPGGRGSVRRQSIASNRGHGTSPGGHGRKRKA